MRTFAFVSLVAAACISLSCAAEAKRNRSAPPPSDQSLIERYYNDPYYGYQNGQVCPRWCPEDRSPCDPVNFKVADGRCSPNR